jgi:hypothetical protein
MVRGMELEYPAFGVIVINGKRYDHDVVIADGQVSARDKGPSKPLKPGYGHTPLAPEEEIPWSKPRLVVGTGHSGRLPVVPDLESEAEQRGVELVVLPTSEAVDLLNRTDQAGVNAILHVTC